MVEIAALVGDTARATMLSALMSGQALTGSELAGLASVSKSTASEHLTRMVDARLLSVMPLRRHRYYRIASPLVAGMLESIKAVAAIETPARHRPRSRQDDALRFARTCYDHLAGRLGVAIADALAARNYVTLSDDGGVVTAVGLRFFGDLGITLPSMSKGHRPVCRACLDWSERRYHIAGALGAAICQHAFQAGWVTQRRDARALCVTPKGLRGFDQAFGVTPMCESFPASDQALKPA